MKAIRRQFQGVSGWAALLIGLVGLLVAFGATARAATQVGSLSVPTTFCAPNTTYLQTTSPGGVTTVPTDGVITSWSIQTIATPPAFQVRLVVGRDTSTTNVYTIVGESALETAPAAATTTTFLTRVPVLAGDYIGEYVGSPVGLCAHAQAPLSNGYIVNAFFDVAAVGTSPTFSPQSDIRLSISANLEADADADGYGDETQDACPADPIRHEAPCTPPVPAACLLMTFDRTVVGTEGPDTINGTGLRELIFGLGGHDKINGGAGNDCIVGGEGNDKLSGGSGNDKLIGEAGDDTLKGDSGTDSAIGGTNNDSCDAESETTCES